MRLFRAGFAQRHMAYAHRTRKPNAEHGSNAWPPASSSSAASRGRCSSATRREFLDALRSELPDALRKMQQGNIAPVDLAQAAIGPGMAIFTRYARVLDASGKAVSVREALALINETLDEVLAEQEGDFDADTRWALAWFDQSGFSEGEYGVAETLSTAKNTSVAGMVEAGILTSGGGKVRLLAPAELPQDWNPKADSRRTVWETTHHLVRVHEQGGDTAAADIMANIGADAETARDLAYRLFRICDLRNRPQEALGYNALVRSWGEISGSGNSGAASPDRAEYVRWGVSHGRHQQRAGWEGARPAERRVGSLRGPGSEGRPFGEPVARQRLAAVHKRPDAVQAPGG